MNGTYRPWRRDRSSWAGYELAGEAHYLPTVRRLCPDISELSDGGREVIRDFELVPEPHNPHDRWAVSVRADGQTIGYLAREDAPAWADPLATIAAAGLTAITSGRIWAWKRTIWDDDDYEADPTYEVAAQVRLQLGDPDAALPRNDPPDGPYTLLPRGGIVQVTKEDQYSATLLPHVPPGGYGTLFTTLRESNAGTTAKPKPIVEVCIDGDVVGVLTPQMGNRYLPMIQHFERRGLATACWADITGSAVAAEVRIDGIKANEADDTILNGPPRTLPPVWALAASGAGSAQVSGESNITLTKTAPTVVEPEPAPTTSLPPAAWFPDPWNPKLLRYWDGSQWTAHTAPRPGGGPG